MILTAVVLNLLNVTKMHQAMLILYIVLGLLAFGSLILSFVYFRSKPLSPGQKLILIMLYMTTLAVLTCTLICSSKYTSVRNQPSTVETNSTSTSEVDIPETETTDDLDFKPNFTDLTNPNKWDIKWVRMQNNTILDSFKRKDPIHFNDSTLYSSLDGVTTFRGDNYRSSATFGTADILNKILTKKWNAKTGSLNGWAGSGWTGQPLIVRWDDQTKSIMNLYDAKKAKTDLVEVIYATLDGNIYFYDLEDGSYTRDPLWIGMNFRGSGSLDPRGYPLLYVGSGDSTSTSSPRMYIISLIDGKVIYEQSGKDIDAYRMWYAFNSAPLIDSQADTLIWPGASGIIYTIKLNTKYDKASGTITVSPENTAKIRYTTNTNREVGCESSCIIVDKYLYFADNGGMFFCVDLDTMEVKWAQNINDCVISTPVFEWDNEGNGYIYTGTMTKYVAGKCYVHKLDATTGEIVWERAFANIVPNTTVNGGIIASPLLGKSGTTLEGLIIYTIAQTPTADTGIVLALDTSTGETVWEKPIENYTWSSPTAIYTNSGAAYFVLCDSAGKATLRDALSGAEITSISLGSNIEASPAVFENTIVVGTKNKGVFGIEIE